MEREDNISEEQEIKKPKVILRKLKNAVTIVESDEEIEKKIKPRAVKSLAKKELVIKRVKGKRRMPDGTYEDYFYDRKYFKPTIETRGAKAKPNKSRLRTLLKDLSDENCKKILDYISEHSMIVTKDLKPRLG